MENENYSHKLSSEPVDSDYPRPVSNMKNSISSFLAARAELAAIEAKEAAEFATKKVIQLILLAGSAFFLWCLVLAALTGIFAPIASGLLEGHTPWLPGWCAVILALAIIHALIALICVYLLKSKPREALFALSRQELENDKKWLKKNK